MQYQITVEKICSRCKRNYTKYNKKDNYYQWVYNKWGRDILCKTCYDVIRKKVKRINNIVQEEIKYCQKCGSTKTCYRATDNHHVWHNNKFGYYRLCNKCYCKLRTIDNNSKKLPQPPKVCSKCGTTETTYRDKYFVWLYNKYGFDILCISCYSKLYSKEYRRIRLSKPDIRCCYNNPTHKTKLVNGRKHFYKHPIIVGALLCRECYVNINPTKYKKRQSSPRKGRKSSLETRMKISIAMRNREFKHEWVEKAAKTSRERGSQKGKNNPQFGKVGSLCSHWNPLTPLIKHIRTSKPYKEWRQAVFDRDEYRCGGCGSRSGAKNVHHIITFKEILIRNNIQTFEQSLLCEELWDIYNGITLCPQCHGIWQHS